MTDHLLPPSATETLRELSLAANRATSLPVAIRDEWSPERCPAHMLPWLAWAVGVEEWDVHWTDAQKRAAIASSLAIKRTKGTIGAVVTAVASLGLGAKVVEWFNQVPAGDPYTFDLTITAGQAGFDQAQWELLLTLIGRTKNVRSHLYQLVLNVESAATLYTAGAPMVGLDIALSYGGSVQLPQGDTLLLLHTEAGDAPAGTLADASRYNRAVTLHGTAAIDSTSGRFGNCLRLNGEGWATSSLARVLKGANFTIEFFIRPDVDGRTGEARFVQIGAPGLDGSVWVGHHTTDGTALVVNMWAWGYEYMAIVASSIPPNQWSHVALVRAGRYQLFVNGELVGEEGSAEGGEISSSDVWIGASGEGTDTFSGRIDELRISSVARYTEPFQPPSTPFTP